jgi:ABC-type Zn2+ transport system substrate-binding protein/surface adhesin
MQPNSNQAHSHDHAHDHAHGPAHTHGSDFLLPPQPAKDLKSPVLSGLAQRLLWVTSLLVVLWLAVFWALRTHG